jgi:hypothetical protein
MRGSALQLTALFPTLTGPQEAMKHLAASAGEVGSELVALWMEYSAAQTPGV